LDVTALSARVDNCKWMNQTAVDRWHSTLRDTILAMNEDFEESLDGLSAISQWVVDHMEQFSSEQQEELEENLRQAVEHEVFLNSDIHDEQRLVGDLAIVEEIARTLDVDLSNEIDHLNEALSELWTRDGDEGDTWRGRPSDNCNSSIESLFDSLLE
jgi:uncharacterized protein YicC (UPF0701 family)